MSLAKNTMNRHEAAALVASVKAEILKQWEELSRENLEAAEAQSRRALRDSLPQFLDHLVDTLSCVDPKTMAEKNSEVAREHGADRASQPEYTLDEVIYEFHILRSVVIDNLDARTHLDGEARRIIHEFIDRGIRKGAVKFTEIELQKERALTKELEAARSDAERANQAKSLFLANMSHEIRTPLGSILGFVDLLKESGLSPASAREYLSIVERNSRHLMRIIDDILDLAKVESGKMDVENVEFSLAEFLGDFSSFAIFKAREKGIAFELRAQTSLPEMLTSDPTRLRQILSNVVGNAIKFTEKGRVDLVVSVEGDRLDFRVSDTGRGISDAQRALLFKSFSQGDSSVNRKFGGTGLGLVLTKKLCEAMGGDFFLIESEVGKGSTFEASVKIEYKKTGLFLGVDEVLNVPQAPLQKVPFPDLKHLKVLLVEDSPDIQVLVQLMLHKTEAQLVVVGDGSEGVRTALSSEFDVVLMDIQMPKMDGHQAIKLLRKEGYKGVVVALTAHAMKDERERGIESGFTAFLTKPIDRKSLLDLLASFTQTK